MTQPFDGVLFDLYGTLVLPFRRREHEKAIEQCAFHLGLSFEDCHSRWVETFPLRVRGEFSSVADNFAAICDGVGADVPRELLVEAEKIYLRFTTDGLLPIDGAIDALMAINQKGVKVGLVSNCAPDVPAAWSSSALAPFFQACAFSCEVRSVKPAPEIYRAALESLELDPARTLFVGDGSDDELSGASACGMHAVLVTADLSNTYDTQRRDVDGWDGDRIAALSGVLDYLE